MKELESLAHIQKKKKKQQSVEIILEEALRLDLVDKDFKSNIIKIFKEIKENMFKELKENMWTVSHKI